MEENKKEKEEAMTTCHQPNLHYYDYEYYYKFLSLFFTSSKTYTSKKPKNPPFIFYQYIHNIYTSVQSEIN